MDKILSSKEWFKSDKQNAICWVTDDDLAFAQAYSNYLLEAFAEEVKSKKYDVDNFNTAVAVEDIDQLLTKFKEKL